MAKKKRGNGEGSLTRRKDCRWMGRYTIYTMNGPKQKAIYGRTRVEVAEELTKTMTDRGGWLVYDAGNLSVGEYLRRWLSDSVRDTVRQRTYEGYAHVVDRHIVPSLGRVKLKALTSAHVRSLYREWLDAGLSPAPSATSTRHLTRRSLRPSWMG